MARATTITASISLSGDKEILRAFGEFPKIMQNRILRKAMTKAAQPIRDRVEQLTPVQSPPFKGQSPNVRLKRLVRVVAGKRSRKRVRRLVAFPVRARLKIPDDAKWYYPAHLEYGHGKVAPRGMMRRALSQKKSEAETILQREVLKEMDRAATELVRKRSGA